MEDKKQTNSKGLENKSGKTLSKGRITLGTVLFIISLIMVVSFTSYLLNWKADQSQAGYMLDKTVQSSNLFGKIGDWLGKIFIFDSIGIAAYLVAFILFMLSTIILKKKYFKPWKTFGHSLFFMCWTPIMLGAITKGEGTLSGVYGHEIATFLDSIIGTAGLWLIIVVSIALYFILEFNLRPSIIKSKFNNIKDQTVDKISPLINNSDNNTENTSNKTEENTSETLSKKQKIKKETINKPSLYTISDDTKNRAKEKQETSIELNPTLNPTTSENKITPPITSTQNSSSTSIEEEVKFNVEVAEEKDDVEEKDKASELVDKVGEYDHKLDLAQFQLPPVDLLQSYDNEEISVNSQELEDNKNRIVGVLNDFNVKIKEIKATIGPTVTLYEIVPEAGVRVSSIKKLQDDIALNLSALGIRIIAPIPGKGTIGIEVPRKNPTMVSMRSVINSKKYQNSKMDLPVVFGKTISNEIFMADLAKMPHLLMAGATGQGKSVGINAILTSLLYKKHPSEIKFVMVDPKKVELTLYSKIERHYLAKLPDSEEAIITDTTKVINTLNSLCIEMDDRYELLKMAFCRNIKEYNNKFKQRKLNPENGHRFLPYIVLVVDEFADLIMTAGKEIEHPIARLAQLARAVGIHLIVATQRPSVNVITGMIKANFPARAAFRVMTGIDSKTILDSPGAEQLIGRGDMLFSNGNDTLRIQCAFVDTPEVEKIADFIGEQKGYSSAFLLPEYEGEDSSSKDSFDPDEKDALFEEAARIVVSTQQGSTSMLQRQLKLGYNRAGRIMDQLEASGIVGGFNGSKARDVQITDMTALEQFLEDLKK